MKKLSDLILAITVTGKRNSSAKRQFRGCDDLNVERVRCFDCPYLQLMSDDDLAATEAYGEDGVVVSLWRCLLELVKDAICVAVGWEL